jgi:replicative DNA helicase
LSDPINEPAATAPQPRLYALSQLLPDWQSDAEAAYDARVNGLPRGPLTGIKKLDLELNGALSPGVHVVHGEPGAGKTAFVLQVASSCQCPALLVTCEMGPLELLRRLTARVTETYLGRLKSGEMRPADSLTLARRAIESAPQLTIVDATQAYASPVYLREVAQNAKGESRHLLIVVDSLHSWVESALSDATEYEAINAGLASLRAFSHQLSCSVLAVVERNRESMKKEVQSSGAGTRKIEYGAETVIALQRDEQAREDGAGEIPIVAKFAKNRNGAAGKSVRLKFNGALQRFTEEA